MWSALLAWLIQLVSMDALHEIVAVVAADADGAADGFEISKHAHANRDNYFHMTGCYLVCIPRCFADDECN